MKKIVYFLIPFLMASCINVDDVREESVSLPIVVSTDIEPLSRATLIEDAATLASVFPTMSIKSSKGMNLDVSTSELAKGSYETGYYWSGSAQTFVSYPKGEIDPTIGDGKVEFTYVPTTDMKDIVVAVDRKNKEGVMLNYQHIFCTVNVIYKSIQTAHKISNVSVFGEVQGKCVVTSSSVTWSLGLSGEGHLYSDKTARQVYHNGQDLGIEKFMFVPLSKPKVYVTIDGKQISHVVTCDPQPGKIINVYIEDDLTFTESEEACVNDEKQIVKDGDSYTLKLTPYIKGVIKDTTITLPTNTVLVLDCSGSMEDKFYVSTFAYHSLFTGNHNLDKLDKNKQYVARVGFLSVARDIKYEYYTPDAKEWVLGLRKGNHWIYYNEFLKEWKAIETSLYRVSIYEKSKYYDTTKMELLKSVCKDYIRNMSKLSGENYISIVKFPSSSSNSQADVLVSQVNVSKDTTALMSAINGLVANGATPADAGLTKAYDLMKDKDKYYNSVIFITDGDPNHSSGYDKTVANAAINASNRCKINCGATVYSVGIFEEDEISDDCDEFLNKVSSNYVGNSKVASGYYTIATSIEAFNLTLSSITKNIKESIANLPVDGSAELRFIFSDLFDISNAQVSVSSGCTYSWNERTLTITGFNYQSLAHADFKVIGLTTTCTDTACSFMSGSGLWYKGVCIEEFSGVDFRI